MDIFLCHIQLFVFQSVYMFIFPTGLIEVIDCFIFAASVSSRVLGIEWLFSSLMNESGSK